LGIPLTLSIIDGMLIQVGDTVYALPILFIKNSFRPDKNDIHTTIDGIELVKIRNEVFPILRLYEILNKKTEVVEPEKGILLILESNNVKVCFLVDNILGQQQIVVKPLSEYLGKIKGITGCFILADGKIGLILDVDNIIKNVGRRIQ
jgi:two-component system, chemotaxis family, sensor kinase CheA